MELSTCDGSKNTAPQQPRSHTLSCCHACLCQCIDEPLSQIRSNMLYLYPHLPTYRLRVIDGTEQALLLAPTTFDDQRVSAATVRCVSQCIISITIIVVV
jgi:hypothetical protein